MNRNDRAIVGVVMAGHALVHTLELSIPILIPLWLAQFDTTAGVIGIVVGVGYALFGLGALPAGVLTDAVGSQRLIGFCMIGMGGSFLVLSLAPTIWAIALALVFWGIAASVYHPAGLTLISNGVVARGRGFAYHGMAGNVGIALGPLLTVLLLIVFDWRTTVALLTIPAFAAGVIALRVPLNETAAMDEGSQVENGGFRSTHEILADTKTLFAGAFLLVFVMVMFSGLYYRGVITFLPEIVGDFPGFEAVAIGERTVEPANYFFVGILLIGIAGQYTGGILTDRIRTEVGLTLGFLGLVGLSVAFIPASEGRFLAFLLVSAFLGFFLFLVQPMYQATVARYAPPDSRGLSFGFLYVGVFGVGAAGAALTGFILDIAGAREVFLVLAGLALLAAGLAAYLIARDP